MDDLIKRADAIEAICNAQCELDVPHYPQCDQIKYCDEIQALLALPSADAIPIEKYHELQHQFVMLGAALADLTEVVLCKECRHRDLFSCPLADNDFQKDDDYCSWGERRWQSK